MKSLHPNWSTAFIFAAVLAAFFFAQHLDADDHQAEWSESQELEAAQQDAAALASREFAGQQMCGPAALATWQDSKTLVCTPKRGQPYRVAASP